MVKVGKGYNKGQLPGTELPGHIKEIKGNLVKVILYKDDELLEVNYALDDGELVPLLGKIKAAQLHDAGLLMVSDLLFIDTKHGELCGVIKYLYAKDSYRMARIILKNREMTINLNYAHSYESIFNQESVQARREFLSIMHCCDRGYTDTHRNELQAS